MCYASRGVCVGCCKCTGAPAERHRGPSSQNRTKDTARARPSWHDGDLSTRSSEQTSVPVLLAYQVSSPTEKKAFGLISVGFFVAAVPPPPPPPLPHCCPGPHVTSTTQLVVGGEATRQERLPHATLVPCMQQRTSKGVRAAQGCALALEGPFHFDFSFVPFPVYFRNTPGVFYSI